mgnify:CR=1 FL=1
MLAERIGALLTREPGGTKIGAGLRSLLLAAAEHPTPMAPRAEALLMAADRAQHAAELLGPTLAQGTDGTRGVVLRSLEAAAAAAGLERVSVLPGFAYQDVARAGMSVLVVHDDEHADMARRLADDTAATLQATADSGGFTLRRPDAATAVQQAMASTSARALLTPSW